MSNTNTGGSAFPHENHYGHKLEGMTLRDYFAAKCLNLAMEDYRMTIDRVDECLDLEWDKSNGLSSVASRAYELADAMLEARKA
jgi:hypothetical protein